MVSQEQQALREHKGQLDNPDLPACPDQTDLLASKDLREI
jgi:hypothetical protein